jgi:hypothetical protein
MRLLEWARLHGGLYAVTRDLVSLVVGIIGTILAGFAIKLGRTQEEISKRQAEIANTQFQIQQRELNKRIQLQLDVLKHITLSDDKEWITYKLIVENKGTKTAPDCSWLIEVDKSDIGLIEVTPLHPDVIQRLPFKTELGSEVIQFTHEMKGKLYPGATAMGADIRVKRALYTPERTTIELEWAAICEDGEVLGELTLTNIILPGDPVHP